MIPLPQQRRSKYKTAGVPENGAPAQLVEKVFLGDALYRRASPLAAARQFTPCGALEREGISPVATGVQRLCLWTSQTFEKA